MPPNPYSPTWKSKRAACSLPTSCRRSTSLLETPRPLHDRACTLRDREQQKSQSKKERHALSTASCVSRRQLTGDRPSDLPVAMITHFSHGDSAVSDKGLTGRPARGTPACTHAHICCSRLSSSEASASLWPLACTPPHPPASGEEWRILPATCQATSIDHCPLKDQRSSNPPPLPLQYSKMNRGKPFPPPSGLQVPKTGPQWPGAWAMLLGSHPPEPEGREASAIEHVLSTQGTKGAACPNAYLSINPGDRGQLKPHTLKINQKTPSSSLTSCQVPGPALLPRELT